MQTGSVVAAYTYDGTLRRIKREVTNSPGRNATYHDYYTRGWQLLETRNGSDQVLQQYVWGLTYIDELVQIAANDDPTDGLEQDVETYHYALQDANFNVLGIVDAAGDLAERYEYTPYGQRQVYVSAGSNDAWCSAAIGASQRVEVGGVGQPYGVNPFGHQGLMHGEKLPGGGLIYNRHRMLNAALGRFAQRDPLGYLDGGNLYELTRSSPILRRDPSGMGSLADVQGGRLIYTCNCGWVDMSHVASRSFGIWKQLQSPPDSRIVTVDGIGFAVSAYSTSTTGGGFHKHWWVRDDLGPEQKKAAALGMFMEFVEGHEAAQAAFVPSWLPFAGIANSSGYSEEDMPSNLIGFYLDVEYPGSVASKVPELCGTVLAVKYSVKVWQTGGGTIINPKAGWKGAFKRGNPIVRQCCAHEKQKWPSKLSKIKPSPKGTTWSDHPYISDSD